MIISLIVAFAKDSEGRRVIGFNNDIPWHFPHDLDRFKEHTNGCPIIMGRKTFESIGRVLPGRTNIIISSQKDLEIPKAEVYNDLDEAIAFAGSINSEVFIIGGQRLYEATVNRATRLYLTSFDIEDIEGDTFFPDWEESKFKLIHKEQAGISGDLFRILERKAVTESVYTSNPANTTAPAVDVSENIPYNLHAIYGMYS
ncbi:MAG: hypothetical protein DRQ89_14245 [Epsilonproteobacteria bacterium]|nr:MAG: hypothetical protein DRQ89_14245 [Campylobacterota bacterium]